MVKMLLKMSKTLVFSIKTQGLIGRNTVSPDRTAYSPVVLFGETVFRPIRPLFRRIGPLVSPAGTFSKTNAPNQTNHPVCAVSSNSYHSLFTRQDCISSFQHTPFFARSCLLLLTSLGCSSSILSCATRSLHLCFLMCLEMAASWCNHVADPSVTREALATQRECQRSHSSPFCFFFAS